MIQSNFLHKPYQTYWGDYNSPAQLNALLAAGLKKIRKKGSLVKKVLEALLAVLGGFYVLVSWLCIVGFIYAAVVAFSDINRAVAGAFGLGVFYVVFRLLGKHLIKFVYKHYKAIP